MIYKEAFFPIPQSFGEIFEIINVFISKSYTLSMNSYFSNLAILRCNLLASSFIVFISFFFQKNAFFYHLLQLLIHLANTVLIYLIFKKVLFILNKETKDSFFTRICISLCTLLWALHSANIEAVLLVTNWTMIFTYTFCLCFIYYEISKIEKNTFPTNRIQIILTSILFLISMFLTECVYSLPLILLFMIFAYQFKASQKIVYSLKNAFLITSPYFIGLFLFALILLIKPTSVINTLITNQAPLYIQHKTSFSYAFFERTLWLTPQLFVHSLKLLFFPKTLSLYQSNFIHLSDSLISMYPSICLLFYLFFLLSPIILFFVFRQRKHCFIYLLIYSFYFSVFPFLHIISPSYCLFADRYCYFPSFLLFFILIQGFYLLMTNKDQKFQASMIAFVLFIVLISGSRTLVRIQDWNDFRKVLQIKHSLTAEMLSKVESWKNHSSTPLHKGKELIDLANKAEESGNQNLMKQLLKTSLVYLAEALEQYKSTLEINTNEPITLKLYGLDQKSLLLKSAYAIASIRNDNYHEDSNNILQFLNPYFENNLNILGINEIVLYSDLLLKASFTNKVKEVLEYGYQKYSYSDEISDRLSDFYFLYEKDFEKGFKILKNEYKYFPNDVLLLHKLFKYYEYIKDPVNQANLAYLIGLREHSSEGYQIACKIYLDINQLKNAKKSLKKLAVLKNNSPITQELEKRYFELNSKVY